MPLRRISLVLGAAAVFIACQVFVLVLIPPRKVDLDHPAAVLAQESRRPQGVEKNDGCPDQPTFMRLDSWKEWDRYNNCSLRVPWVAKEKPSSNGARGEPGKLVGTSLPLFLILGEQKAGTTFLRMLLDQHPRLRAGLGLYGRPAGETHYFDKAVRGRFIPQEPAAMAKAYAEYFAIQAEDMDDEDTMPFGFDTSPSYLAWQEAVPLRVSSILPSTKLVLLVRDPVERYESARKMYLCFKKKVQERGEQFHEEHGMVTYLATAAASSKASFMPIQRGLYMANLRRWLLHFRREQILLLDSHDLFHAPTQTLQRVLDFVGLPVFTPNVERALKKGQNKGADCGDHEDHYVLAQDDRDALAAFYHQPTKELEHFLGRELPWEKPPL